MESPQGVFAKYRTAELPGHKKRVTHLSWNCTGRKLATGSADQRLLLWSIERHVPSKPGRPDADLRGHTKPVLVTAWDPAHADRLASIGEDHTVRFWDSRTAKPTATVTLPGNLIHMAWSYDSNYLAVGSTEDVINYIDVRKAKVYKTRKYDYEVDELAWTRDSKTVLQCTAAGTVEFISFPSLERQRQLQGHSTLCRAIAVDSKERWMASGGSDGVVCIWDFHDMVCVRTLTLWDTVLRTLSFSHDGRWLAAAAEEPMLTVHDTESGVLLHQALLKKPADCVAWNPKYNILAYAGSYVDDSHDVRNEYGVFNVWGPAN